MRLDSIDIDFQVINFPCLWGFDFKKHRERNITETLNKTILFRFESKLGLYNTHKSFIDSDTELHNLTGFSNIK